MPSPIGSPPAWAPESSKSESDSDNRIQWFTVKRPEIKMDAKSSPNYVEHPSVPLGFSQDSSPVKESIKAQVSGNNDELHGGTGGVSLYDRPYMKWHNLKSYVGEDDSDDDEDDLFAPDWLDYPEYESFPSASELAKMKVLDDQKARFNREKKARIRAYYLAQNRALAKKFAAEAKVKHPVEDVSENDSSTGKQSQFRKALKAPAVKYCDDNGFNGQDEVSKAAPGTKEFEEKPKSQAKGIFKPRDPDMSDPDSKSSK